MSWFVLVALFTTPTNMNPHYEDGFEPRIYATHAECEVNRARLRAFLDEKVKNDKVKSSAFCVRVSVHGYLDGEANLRRMTGDPA